MVLTDRESLLRELRAAIGDALRVVATYDRDGYDPVYVRENVADRVDGVGALVHPVSHILAHVDRVVSVPVVGRDHPKRVADRCPESPEKRLSVSENHSPGYSFRVEQSSG